jgi:putative glutamine amidotransferase
MNIAFSLSSKSKYAEKYTKWMYATNNNIHIINMNDYSIEEFNDVLKTCVGIVFTGGPDVHPSYYNQESRIADCKVDELRDIREIKMMEICQSLNMPILAICRGQQLYNIFNGGSLIVDIPKDLQSHIEHKSINGVDSQHKITIQPNTLLRKITSTDSLTVNSSHHQAVKELPNIFTISAIAEDGIIEAFEWSPTCDNPFLLAVQWHPERLEYSHPCSLPIAHRFLMEAELYSLLNMISNTNNPKTLKE